MAATLMLCQEGHTQPPPPGGPGAAGPGFSSAPSLTPEEQQRRLQRKFVDETVAHLRDLYGQGRYAEVVRDADEALRTVPDAGGIVMYKRFAAEKIAKGDTAPPGTRMSLGGDPLSTRTLTTTGTAGSPPVVFGVAVTPTPDTRPVATPTPAPAAAPAPAAPSSSVSSGTLLKVLGGILAAAVLVLAGLYGKTVLAGRLAARRLAKAEAAAAADEAEAVEEEEQEFRPRGMYIPPIPATATAKAELPTASVEPVAEPVAETPPDPDAPSVAEAPSSFTADPFAVTTPLPAQTAPAEPDGNIEFPDDMPLPGSPQDTVAGFTLPPELVPKSRGDEPLTLSDPGEPSPATADTPALAMPQLPDIALPPIAAPAPPVRPLENSGVEVISFEDLGIELPGLPDVPTLPRPLAPPPASLVSKVETVEDLIPMSVEPPVPPLAERAKPQPAQADSPDPPPIRLSDFVSNESPQPSKPEVPASTQTPASEPIRLPDQTVRLSSPGSPAAVAPSDIPVISLDETLHGQETVMLAPTELPGPPSAEAIRNLEAKQEETIGVSAAGPAPSAEESKPGLKDTDSGSGYYVAAGGSGTNERTEKMFRDQWDKAQHAVAGKNWKSAVHHLSIAAAIRPDNEEVRQALKEARRQKHQQDQGA